MNQNLLKIAERRRRLIDEAAQQRVAIAQEVEPWRPILARADQGLAALRYLKEHPAWLVGGGVLVAMIGRTRLWQWLGRGLVAWRMLNSLG